MRFLWEFVEGEAAAAEGAAAAVEIVDGRAFFLCETGADFGGAGAAAVVVGGCGGEGRTGSVEGCV